MEQTHDEYMAADGTWRTTCPDHRTLGYYIAGHKPNGVPVWACKGCGQTPLRHETPDETVARRKAEALA